LAKRSIYWRVFRVLARIVAGLVTVLVVLFLALQIPFVQQWVTGKVETTARRALKTDLGIGAIRWKFPSGVTLRDCYLNNPTGDSIARLEYLSVGINMMALLKKEVQITGLTAQNVFGNIAQGDSTGNIQFLLDLGRSPKTPTVPRIPPRELPGRLLPVTRISI
jgi:translocation and assembly module TamB